MLFLYSSLLYLIQPLIWLRLLYRSIKAPAYYQRWPERYGHSQDKVKQGGILIHAVSVGETMAVVPFIHRLQQQYPTLPITITTMTPTGSARVSAIFHNTVGHCYLPYDLPHVMKRFIKQINPTLVVIMETEIWPNFVYALSKKQIPVILANARLSARSAARYQYLAHTMKTLLEQFSIIAAQTEQDGERFLTLGLPSTKLQIMGNLKFDLIIPEQHQQQACHLKQQWAAHRAVWIAASTHQGEDDIILATHQKLLTIFPHLLLILVPRHPERFKPVEKDLKAYHMTYQRRSDHLTPSENTQVVLGDTMGELTLLYGIADIAFIGGSLIPHGGQNPLEAIAYGLPILMGPSRFNFTDICQQLKQAKLLTDVDGRDTLYDEIHRLLTLSEAQRTVINNQAKKVIRDNQGACVKLLNMVSPYLTKYTEH